MTGPTNSRVSLESAISQAMAEKAPDRPYWVDPALAQVRRATSDPFWFNGLGSTAQHALWARREQLIQLGYLTDGATA